jgi:outer membrane biosynthesis protein TonB
LKKRFNIKIDNDEKAGLYLTVIFHLILIIVILAYSIHRTVSQETSFVLDFTKQEELEREREIQAFKESVSAELDELIAQSRQSAPRNVAVDASRSGERLRDDRSANPSEVYDEARRLQEKLDASRREAQEAMDSEDNVAIGQKKEETKSKETYVGPSVLSYRLEGRKGQSLPIPAYKCIGGGDVTVAIIVNRKGYVVNVKVVENVSSPDICLQDYAMRAAKRSRFTASSTAPERQAGEIVYRFIAQ